MLVNDKIINQLYRDAGETRVQKARLYVRTGRTEIEKIHYEDKDNVNITGRVRGQEVYRTHISVKNGEIEDVTCECIDYQNRYASCKHIVATMIEFTENHKYEEILKNNNSIEINKSLNTDSKYRSFKQIVNIFYAEKMQEIEQEDIKDEKVEEVKIEPRIIYDKYSNNLKIDFKIGNQRMYKIKDLTEFYDRMVGEQNYRYGNKLEFKHNLKAFAETDRELVEFVLKYAEIIKFVNSDSNSNYRYYGKALSESYITLNSTGIDEIFEILKSRKVIFQKEYEEEKVEFKDGNPELYFILQKKGKDEYKIKINRNIDILRDIEIIQGKAYSYILFEDVLYRCDAKYKETTLKLLEILKENFLTELILGKEQLPEFFSIILPKMKEGIELKGIEEKEIEKYKPQKLGVKVFLDFDENDYILADVKFCYGEEEFNPLQPEINIKYSRDIIAENKCINMLRKTGFMYYAKKECFILPDDDKIYEFLSNDINEYMQKFEVMITDNFKTKQIKQPKIGSLGIKIESGLLNVNLENLNIDIKELQEVMKKYNLKKKYYKLKDGSFINLEENADIEFIDKLITGMDINVKEIEEGTIKLPINRTLYLDQLLKTVTNTPINKDKEYKEIITEFKKENIEDEISIPKSLEKTLRYYQKTGYKWLKTLDNYKFGGILADDMGLGKTIQMLSVIAGYVEEREEKRASIVICPSSLTLNWQNESKKFTNKLKTLVIRGNAEERKRQINQIENYDIIITSYDLLKRDIEIYKEKDYQFRFSIADEAQYLKNSNTQNAKVVKEIKADTRYALTGTPIENSLAELWSIFDYIMPGYLFQYKKFKTLFEVPIVKDNDNRTMQKLKMLIEPFVLRRTKKEVLTELPEKTITILNNQMKKEQEKIYLNYLAEIKQEVAETINLKGFEKSHIQILAALTRLRQICCHPSLFIKNYKDGSSKLEQCIEIIQDATESGHKILLFSGYTSMFEILEKELVSKNISYFKLTGSTKVDQRIKMVDEFNENKDIKVFLISLKAGGTGLNLTGADMVIHYDPWWNASAENQATDRAYRIGQKNNVQVYKLITKNSIEEKIYELQQKKTQLIDSVLDTKTSFISKLSKEEIMKLFE
jgi:SNF2 family DNA or RNA helicase